MNKTLRPGDILYNQFMCPRNMTYYDMSVAIEISIESILSLIDGKLDITEELDSKLNWYFGTEVGYWLELQKNYEGNKWQ